MINPSLQVTAEILWAYTLRQKVLSRLTLYRNSIARRNVVGRYIITKDSQDGSVIDRL
jgi:hypothetical protein